MTWGTVWEILLIYYFRSSIKAHWKMLPPLSFWLSRLWGGKKAVSNVSKPTLKNLSFIPLFCPPLPSFPHIAPYRQGPGDKGELPLDTEQDHAEEDDGEDPENDGHKQHPAIRWQQIVWSAGYQWPLEQSKKLERWETKKIRQINKRRWLVSNYWLCYNAPLVWSLLHYTNDHFDWRKK